MKGVVGWLKSQRRESPRSCWFAEPSSGGFQQGCMRVISGVDISSWIATIEKSQFCGHVQIFDRNYPLVDVYITMERSTTCSEKTHYEWSFSIAMLNYQRVLHLFEGFFACSFHPKNWHYLDDYWGFGGLNQSWFGCFGVVLKISSTWLEQETPVWFCCNQQSTACPKTDLLAAEAGFKCSWQTFKKNTLVSSLQFFGVEHPWFCQWYDHSWLTPNKTDWQVLKNDSYCRFRKVPPNLFWQSI